MISILLFECFFELDEYGPEGMVDGESDGKIVGIFRRPSARIGFSL